MRSFSVASRVKPQRLATEQEAMFLSAARMVTQCISSFLKAISVKAFTALLMMPFLVKSFASQ